SFQAIFFRQLEQLFSLFQLMIGIAKPPGGVHQSREKLLAFEQRSFTKVVAIAVKKIEDKVNDRDLRDEMLAGSTHVHAFLQTFEVAKTLGIQSHNLSVKDSFTCRQGFGKGSQFGVAL